MGVSAYPGGLVECPIQDLAIAGDQGGSVRMPAGWSGVVGIKATFGLVPYTGAFPIEYTIDNLGPIARTVDDVALLQKLHARNRIEALATARCLRLL